jgi:hypothetical protein
MGKSLMAASDLSFHPSNDLDQALPDLYRAGSAWQ